MSMWNNYPASTVCGATPTAGRNGRPECLPHMIFGQALSYPQRGLPGLLEFSDVRVHDQPSTDAGNS